MAKKIVEAREIEYPDNLCELTEKLMGIKQGGLAEVMADHGEIRNMNKHLLIIGLAIHVSQFLESKDLPHKPMSLARLSDTAHVVSFAYLTGTMGYKENGELVIGKGTLESIAFAGEIMSAEKIRLRNGKVISNYMMNSMLSTLTQESALKEIHKDITPLIGNGNKLKDEHSLKLARTLVESIDMLQEIATK